MVNNFKFAYRDFSHYIQSLDYLFWLLLIVFSVIPLLYFSYVPIWDGWEFAGCYVNAALNNKLGCFEHSAFINVFLFSLTQRIDLGYFKLIYTLNILLGIVGLLSFRSLVDFLYQSRLSAVNKTLLSFAFGLASIFIVHIIQPSLDYTLPIFFVMLLLFLFQKRFALACVAGMLLVFTKESGFMLYGISVFLYFIYLFLKDPSWIKNKTNLSYSASILILPIIAFVLYMILVPSTQVGDSWIDGIKKMFHFYLVTKVMLAQFISIFVINFMWIVTLFILAGILYQAKNIFIDKVSPEKSLIGFSSRYEQLYFYILAFSVLYFLTRIPFVNNPRYMLALLPLLIIILGESLIVLINKQRVITAVLSVLLLLFTASSFKTIDPVARAAMGTFKFGSNSMLHMARFDSTVYGYGRDQLVYNFEFTNFHYLTEDIFRELGWDKVYVVSQAATWERSYSTFDIRNGKRHIYGDDVLTIPVFTTKKVMESSPIPEDIYFISYPNSDRNNKNNIKMDSLSSLYNFEETLTFERNGYSIDVFRFTLKNK